MELEKVIEKIKILLDMEDTKIYDLKLEILIPGAISKLANEGVPSYLDAPEALKNIFNDYLICLSYQVAIDLDLDIDLDKLYSMYITRVNTLRLASAG